MSRHWFDPTVARSSSLGPRQAAIVCGLSGALLAGSASAAPGDNLSVVRDLASRVGPIIGSALGCQNVSESRLQLIIDKFQEVIKGSTTNDADRSDVARLLNRYVADGRTDLAAGRTNCKIADRQIADLEASLKAPPKPSPMPSLVDAITPTPANAAVAPTQALPPVNAHGITDHEIKFGIVIPFTGIAKDNGKNMKLGVDLAFQRANDNGGVAGKMLKLVAADDGSEPSRTLDAMKTLWEKEQVFGFIGNPGAPTAAVAVPYAQDRHALFFGALTGANVVRHDPPDRYVFNYRPSDTEEVDAAVRYLVKVRKLQPRQIAVFAQNDSYGDSGFQGVAKAFRALGMSDTSILRLNYARNSVDVDEAVNTLRLQKAAIRAVVMVATTRPAAVFIEKTHDLFPGMIYANVSTVGASSLAEELSLLGPRFTQGVVVTQTVPAVTGFSTAVLEYKNALAKYYPGEKPDYISLEGFISANVLIDGLRRCGPQIDSERLVDVLENTHNLDLGLGAAMGFSRSEHQASHKVWGTALDDTGKYQAIDLE
jgi:branched-chain amino acid transport system substrate-binding protein